MPRKFQPQTKAWTRSDTLPLALHSCVICGGRGLRLVRGRTNPCKCVLRAIFRICLGRFRNCMTGSRQSAPLTLDRGTNHDGRRRRYVWSRKEQEYAADFYLVSKRTLTPEEWDLFRFHFLLGADWKFCCERLRMDRGSFYHETYRIAEKLGRVFKELEPYSLFPLDEYFGGTRQRAPDKDQIVCECGDPEEEAPAAGPPTVGPQRLCVPLRAG